MTATDTFEMTFMHLSSNYAMFIRTTFAALPTLKEMRPFDRQSWKCSHWLEYSLLVRQRCVRKVVPFPVIKTLVP